MITINTPLFSVGTGLKSPEVFQPDFLNKYLVGVIWKDFGIEQRLEQYHTPCNNRFIDV